MFFLISHEFVLFVCLKAQDPKQFKKSIVEKYLRLEPSLLPETHRLNLYYRDI